MGKESIQSAPLKEQVAVDHGRDATQLKAEHGKEMAALKAEEAQALAAQKAEHSKTPGKTGLIAKLTGKEDPVKKAEKEQLKAEIARAEETTKAAHDHENAELKAQNSKHMATANAVDNLHGSSNHAGALPVAGGVAHGAHGSRTDGHAIGAGIPDKQIYNHATGAHGQAALADNGVHNHNHQHGIAAFADNGLGDRHHHDNNQGGAYNQGGLAQGGLAQGGFAQAPMMGGAVPVAVMPVMQQAAIPVAMAAAPLATHGAPLASVPLATHGAPLATHAAPLATHGATHMSGGTQPVAVIAPSHSNRL